MKRQDQTVKHNPPESWGDCFRTTIANLVGLDASEVPHFLDGDRGWDEALPQLNAFLRPYGLAFVFLSANPRRLLGSLGIVGCHYEGGGSTERGTTHSGAFCDGELLHDPHPSHAGFTCVDDQLGLFIALRPWEVVEQSSRSGGAS